MANAHIFSGTVLWQGKKEKKGTFFHLFIFCLLRFCSTSPSPRLTSLSPCVAVSWHQPCPFFPGFLSFLMHVFKFRKAELKTVFRGKKVLYFHNCMLSIFNAIFGHHNLFVWFCWHVLFWLLRQRGQKFPASYPLWRQGLSWAVS